MASEILSLIERYEAEAIAAEDAADEVKNGSDLSALVTLERRKAASDVTRQLRSDAHNLCFRGDPMAAELLRVRERLEIAEVALSSAQAEASKYEAREGVLRDVLEIAEVALSSAQAEASKYEAREGVLRDVRGVAAQALEKATALESVPLRKIVALLDADLSLFPACGGCVHAVHVGPCFGGAVDTEKADALRLRELRDRLTVSDAERLKLRAVLGAIFVVAQDVEKMPDWQEGAPKDRQTYILARRLFSLLATCGVVS